MVLLIHLVQVVGQFLRDLALNLLVRHHGLGQMY